MGSSARTTDSWRTLVAQLLRPCRETDGPPPKDETIPGGLDKLCRMSERPSNAGMGFGDKLRSLRERAGFTQEELAELAGLTPHAISALERGTRTALIPHRSLAC